jgi:hypothetical protein
MVGERDEGVKNVVVKQCRRIGVVECVRRKHTTHTHTRGE